MKIGLTCRQADSLKEIGLVYIVIIQRDVSVRNVGAVESAFNNSRDAWNEKTRLDEAYRLPDAFLMVDLRVLGLKFEG